MERFDAFYTEIARECGSMDKLIDSFMSFLQRRTDFFYEADPGDHMGFPPGACETMIASSFKRYQEEHYKKHPKKSIEDYKKKLELYNEKDNASHPTAGKKEDPRPTSESAKPVEIPKQPQVTVPAPAPKSAPEPPKSGVPQQTKSSDIRYGNQHF